MKYFRIILSLLFLSVLIKYSVGQTNTIYYMGTVPQSYYLNPATQPACNGYFGIPIASQVHFNANTSNISLSDFFMEDPLPGSDSIITPFHPRGDVDAFLAKLDDVESLSFEAGSSILSFGFRVQEMYFSFDATLRTNTQFTYTKDFIEGRLKGFDKDRTYNFTEGEIEHLDYSSISINISRNFNDVFQVGIRPKMLFGLGTIQTVNNNTSLYTSTDKWVLDADYEARVAAVGLQIPVDEEGAFDPDGDIEWDSTLKTPADYQKIITKNTGFGIDFGAHYMPIENLQLSLSVLDLGYIKWKDNTHVAKVNGTYTFSGIDIADTANADKIADNILDSLKENLNITGSDEVFKSKLTPKLIVGGRYFITQGLDVGLLYRADFYKSFTDHDLILSANWHPIPLISLSGSFSLLSKTYSTFGLGIGLKLGPLNYYMVLDDVPFKYDKLKTEDMPVSIPLSVDQSSYNIRFGVNLVFGCNQRKKALQDRPLFNSSDWIL